MKIKQKAEREDWGGGEEIIFASLCILQNHIFAKFHQLARYAVSCEILLRKIYYLSPVVVRFRNGFAKLPAYAINRRLKFARFDFPAIIHGCLDIPGFAVSPRSLGECPRAVFLADSFVKIREFVPSDVFETLDERSL